MTCIYETLAIMCRRYILDGSALTCRRYATDLYGPRPHGQSCGMDRCGQMCGICDVSCIPVSAAHVIRAILFQKDVAIHSVPRSMQGPSGRAGSRELAEMLSVSP